MSTEDKTTLKDDVRYDDTSTVHDVADNNDASKNISRSAKPNAKHPKQYDEHKVNNQRARDDYFLSLSSNFAPSRREYKDSVESNVPNRIPVTMHARNTVKRFADRSDLELYGMHLEADYRYVGRAVIIVPSICFVSYFRVVAAAIMGCNTDLWSFCKYIVYMFLACSGGIFVIWISGLGNPYKRELRRRGTMKKAEREWSELQWSRITAQNNSVDGKTR